MEGQENIQEILSKRLYLCQFLCALMILRTGARLSQCLLPDDLSQSVASHCVDPGGSFVCKLFDVFTPFSVGLVYLMYRSFNHVTLIKPVTSRPANSERSATAHHSAHLSCGCLMLHVYVLVAGTSSARASAPTAAVCASTCSK